MSLSDFIAQGKDPSVNFLFKPLLITGFARFIHNENVDFNGSLPMHSPLGVSPQYFHASNVRVLVVDDNAINRKVAEGFLRTFDIHVDEASSGAEALEKAATTVYDLVLMDHVMPEMDGLETTRLLRGQKEYVDTPIIMLTANASSEYTALYKSAGITDILHKPIEFALFVDCMQKWVKKDVPADSKEGPWIASLDREKALEYTGSEKNLAVILKVFVRSAPKLLAALEQAHEESDRSAYRIAAHSLISVSANIGGIALSAKARELEQAILSEKDETAERVYPEVRDRFAELISDVKNYTEGTR